jgi:hypothetical protein
MKRTELREAFFAETRSDPFAHMVSHLAAECWALGYEQALRDNGLTEQRLRKTFGDRMNDAIAFLTEREERAKMLIALAQAGKRLGTP